MRDPTHRQFPEIGDGKLCAVDVDVADPHHPTQHREQIKVDERRYHELFAAHPIAEGAAVPAVIYQRGNARVNDQHAQ